MALSVYIASTQTDLADHRDAVKAVIPTLRGDDDYPWYKCTSVEYRTSDATPSLDEYYSALDGASIVVLLIGWRYGFIPEGSEKSVLELEYERAVESNKSVICYVIDERYPIPPRLLEHGEGAARLKLFKERLKRERTVDTFSTPEDLARKVAVDLTRYYTFSIDRTAEDIIARPRLESELRDCEETNKRLTAIIDSLRQRLNNKVPAEPIWTTRNFEIDSSLCFVLMPFGDRFFQIYEQAVAPAAESAGLRCMHAGEIFNNREIVEDIWESICIAQVIVADVTDRNPNVFYELGICHTLGKEVVVVTQRGDDVPFDIRHRRYIEYSEDGLTTLKARLGKTIKNVVLRVGSSSSNNDA